MENTMKTSKDQLMELVKLMRGYGHRMIVNLSEEDSTWVPANTKGRSIHSYFHHFGQIAHIRYALENPPIDDDTYNWSTVMDSIVRLKLAMK